MNILEHSNDKSKPNSHLRAARSTAFREYLNRKGTLTISDELYKIAKCEGWNKIEIDNAINDLAEAEIVKIEHQSLWLTVSLIVDADSEVKKL